MTIGDRIRAARVGAGLTQAALAARVQVSVVSASRWETNHTTPRAETIGEIAKATGKSSSFFLDDDEAEDERAARLAAAKQRVADEFAALLEMLAAEKHATS